MIEQFLPDSLNFLNPTMVLTATDMIVAMAISFVTGLFIFFVYLQTFNGVMYSKSFATSLIAMNLITTLIILAIAQHFIISIGMIGALSIIRFRTVVKEPLDLVFLFWSIAVGIIVGAGLITLAIIGSAIIGVVLFVFVNRKATNISYILIIRISNLKAEKNVFTIVKQSTKKHVVKVKTISSNDEVELTIEVRLKAQETEFVNELSSANGVINASLVSYNGEYYM